MSTDDKTIIADPGNLTVFNPGNRSRACLVQYSGAKLGRRYPLDEPEVIIGRSTTATICINEQSVSRQQAVLRQVGQDFEIEDLGSSNGTFINDQRITTKVKLRDSDLVRLGTIVLKYFAHDNIDGMIQDKIYRMATIDAGTQIFNKQYITEALTAEVRTAQINDQSLSILYFDLDHFKKVNDNYGHSAGDRVLKECATLAKSAIRKEDILGRFGGEEFVVILPQTSLKTAADLAERIRLAISGYTFAFQTDKQGNPLEIKHTQTVSLGVAQWNSVMRSAKDLLDLADRKLYESKNGGRNRVTA
jgi:two-component system, cell cycle response regulator